MKKITYLSVIILILGIITSQAQIRKKMYGQNTLLQKQSSYLPRQKRLYKFQIDGNEYTLKQPNFIKNGKFFKLGSITLNLAAKNYTNLLDKQKAYKEGIIIQGDLITQNRFPVIIMKNVPVRTRSKLRQFNRREYKQHILNEQVFFSDITLFKWMFQPYGKILGKPYIIHFTHRPALHIYETGQLAPIKNKLKQFYITKGRTLIRYGTYYFKPQPFAAILE